MIDIPTDLVLVIDPGKTTGIALYDVNRSTDTVTVVWSDELNYLDTCNRINETLLNNGQGVTVVVERFTITPQTGKNGPGALDAIGIIGVVRYLCAAYKTPEITYQSPQQAKQFCDNTRLKSLGIWHKGGGGHARDALRHGVLYLVSKGWRPADLLTN